MHAVNASSYCSRAGNAAIYLVTDTPRKRSGQDGVAHKVVNMATTGVRPPGKTALHFACDASDVSYGRDRIVDALLNANADIEARDSKGNTPFLLAAGVGITNVVKLLIDRGAHLHVTNNNGKGALQRARESSSDVRQLLVRHGLWDTHARSDYRRANTNPQRQARYAMANRDPTSRFYNTSQVSRRHRD